MPTFHPRSRSSVLRLALVVVGSTFGLSTAPFALAQATPASTAAAEPVRKIAEWNLPKSSKLAIDGYDPVAYFPEGGGKPAKGDAKFTTEYRGVNYRFTSTEHRDLFLANPARYEPAYGGWCAWATKDGDKVEIDPKSFIVKDNRLFLFYDGFLADTRAKWLKGDHATECKTADEQWMKISGEAPRSGDQAAAPMAAPTIAQAPTTSGTLQTKLDARWTEATQKAPADQLTKYEQGIRDIGSSGVLNTALKVGATAPDFDLPDATGKSVSLRSMLASGPVVLTWYRGGWCPFCNIQLHEYQESLSEFTAAGAKLVAISPQTPDNSLSTAEKNALTFTVLSDKGNRVASAYGLTYKRPEATRSDLSKFNGENSAELPIAATYVIDPSGKVTYAFIDADYRKRAEPQAILDAIKAVKK